MIFIVQAVPARAKMLVYLQRQIPNLRLVLEDGRGPSTTFLRSISAAGGRPHVHLEEDVILPFNFAGLVDAAVQQVGPHHVINFHRFSQRYRAAPVWRPGFAPPSSS